MGRRKASWAMAVASVALAVTAAAAQDTGSRQTRDFVEAAAQSDQFEILEGHTVLAQSTDPRIRAFAKRMIQDHGQTSLKLKQAAARAGVRPPPPGLADDQAHMLGALQSVRGPEFDQVYLRQQALAHHSALVTEQTYATSGDSPPLRQAAASATPIISSHLAMVEQMQAKAADH